MQKVEVVEHSLSVANNVVAPNRPVTFTGTVRFNGVADGKMQVMVYVNNRLVKTYYYKVRGNTAQYQFALSFTTPGVYEVRAYARLADFVPLPQPIPRRAYA